MIDGVAIVPKDPRIAIVKHSRCGKIYACDLKRLLDNLDRSTVRSMLNSFREIPFESVAHFNYHKTKMDYMYPSIEGSRMACGDDVGNVWVYDLDVLSQCMEDGAPSAMQFEPISVLVNPRLANPTYENRKVVDETKVRLFNCVCFNQNQLIVVFIHSLS